MKPRTEAQVSRYERLHPPMLKQVAIQPIKEPTITFPFKNQDPNIGEVAPKPRPTIVFYSGSTINKSVNSNVKNPGDTSISDENAQKEPSSDFLTSRPAFYSQSSENIDSRELSNYTKPLQSDRDDIGTKSELTCPRCSLSSEGKLYVEFLKHIRDCLTEDPHEMKVMNYLDVWKVWSITPVLFFFLVTHQMYIMPLSTQTTFESIPIAIVLLLL